MKNFINHIQKWERGIAVSIFLILVFFAGNSSVFKNSRVVQTQVLSAKTHIVPTPTITPTPTAQLVTIINNIYVPTQIPVIVTPTSTSLPTVSTPTPTPFVQSTPTPSPTLVQASSTPTILPTLTPTSTPIPQSIEIDIDYAGEHAASTYSTTITSGETAWQAVQNAVGIANIQYTDYGGDLGIFITGFNGVNASSSQYYDFQVNGTSSSVGVSSYTVANNDVLKFVLTTF